MTILQVTSSANRSGGTRQALLLARGLTAEGHRVVFVAPRGSPAEGWARDAELECRSLEFGNLWGQWRSSRALRRVVEAVGAEVVHAHHTKGHNVAAMATLGGRFPPVVANRGVLFPPEFPWKFRSSRTAAVITNSSCVKGVLEQSGVPGRKIHVVYNAKEVPSNGDFRSVAPDLRRELELDVAWPVVGTVGGARPEKGFQFLVEAAPRILERVPETRFVLVGAGTERFEARLEELGLRDRFRLPGHRDDAVDIMELFDLFVLPSVDMESCPNVLLEAMAAGVPVVGSDVGGVGEVMRDQVTGLLVPPGDPLALSAAAVEILSAPGRARGMGARGRERVAREFSVESKVEGTLRVYEEVLGR